MIAIHQNYKNLEIFKNGCYNAQRIFQGLPENRSTLRYVKLAIIPSLHSETKSTQIIGFINALRIYL